MRNAFKRIMESLNSVLAMIGQGFEEVGGMIGGFGRGFLAGFAGVEAGGKKKTAYEKHLEEQVRRDMTKGQVLKFDVANTPPGRDAKAVLEFVNSKDRDPVALHQIAEKIGDRKTRQWCITAAARNPELVQGATAREVYNHITGRHLIEGLAPVARAATTPDAMFDMHRGAASRISQELTGTKPSPTFGRRQADMTAEAGNVTRLTPTSAYERSRAAFKEAREAARATADQSFGTAMALRPAHATVH